MVVAPLLVGVDAPVLAAGALEPEAVPFKQLVLPKLNKNTEPIFKIKFTTYRPTGLRTEQIEQKLQCYHGA